MKTTLDGIEQYLWGKLKEFPDYDCRSPHPPKAALHLYYKQGWSMVNRLKMLLFTCSSSYGNSWPFAVNGELCDDRRLFDIRCQTEGCGEWAEAILNEIRTGKRTWKHGRWEYEFAPVPNAPLFLCFRHAYEKSTGETYTPPTDEESMRSVALWYATDRMHRERPPQVLKLDCGLTVDQHVIMDESYLRRLAELTEEEYQRLKSIN